MIERYVARVVLICAAVAFVHYAIQPVPHVGLLTAAMIGSSVLFGVVVEVRAMAAAKLRAKPPSNAKYQLAVVTRAASKPLVAFVDGWRTTDDRVITVQAYEDSSELPAQVPFDAVVVHEDLVDAFQDDAFGAAKKMMLLRTRLALPTAARDRVGWSHIRGPGDLFDALPIDKSGPPAGVRRLMWTLIATAFGIGLALFLLWH